MPPPPRQGILLNRMQVRNRKTLLILVMFVFWSWGVCVCPLCVLTYRFRSTCGENRICGCVRSGSLTRIVVSKVIAKLVDKADFEVGATLGAL